jgi:ribosomal RNA methyltransferase Nop2
MGRRAKNKQSAPEPLQSKSFPTKKLGKRKAEQDADADPKVHPRPVKKLKDSRKVNTGSAARRIEGVTNPPKNGGRAVSSLSSSDGWEDVEDDSLDSQTEYIWFLLLCNRKLILFRSTSFHDKDEQLTSDSDDKSEDDDEYDSSMYANYIYDLYCNAVTIRSLLKNSILILMKKTMNLHFLRRRR